jgi:hypothetical protein
VIAGAVGLVVTLCGCSQISALAPVGGDAIAEVRYGAIDVLLAEGVDVLEAPVCALADGTSVATATPAPAPTALSSTAPQPATRAPAAAPQPGSGATLTASTASGVVTCTGSTVSGDAITVLSSTAPDARLDVEVGGRSLYSGSLQTVIDEAARP